MIHRAAPMACLLAPLLFCTVSSFAELGPMPKTWVNGGPYTLEGMKGKIAVLYFYEEGCPSCRAKWPGLVNAAKAFENEPVIFIAVNSGNPAGAVSGYLKAVNADWPAIVDQSRAFEKTAGVGTISLRNIYQMRILKPNGELTYASTNPAQFSQQIKGMLQSGDAKWNIGPATVPTKYRKAWKASEFGNMKALTPVLRVRSSDPMTQKFVAAANAMIDKAIAERMAAAAEHKANGENWAAYKGYESVAVDFSGHKLASVAKKELSPLRRDKKVSTELKARTALDKVMTMLRSPSYKTQQAARKYLQQLAIKYQGTEAAATAHTMGRPTS